MLQEMLACLQPKVGGLYADLTYGCGGYAAAIHRYSNRCLFAADRDDDAVLRGQSDPRVQIHHLRFSELHAYLTKEGIIFDGIVADLGVCSTQIDDPVRGFSFNHDGPLSMQMGRSDESALSVIQNATADELQEMFQVYGEERRAKTLAQLIFAARNQIRSTSDLARLISDNVARVGRTHPATQVFQALRIAVNAELEELDVLLKHAQSWLKIGGRLVITTFHSLEDRMVKHAMREWVVSGRAIVSRAEVLRNPRARSAKVRWGEKG
jgi:16S rRNA (cytosine1402-N4)-methyltransferase